jgi:hypothetical protein
MEEGSGPPKATHAYRGFLPCGHLNWLAVDTLERSEALGLADGIGEIIRSGGWIDRVPIDEARRGKFGCPPGCPSWKVNNQ